jgi:hypothetical protein
MSSVDNTANALKYLPIQVTVEYFHSLPDDVIKNMYGWFIGDEFDYRDNHTKERRAYYLYACFSIAKEGSDNAFYMRNQLEFYILNHE